MGQTNSLAILRFATLLSTFCRRVMCHLRRARPLSPFLFRGFCNRWALHVTRVLPQVPEWDVVRWCFLTRFHFRMPRFHTMQLIQRKNCNASRAHLGTYVTTFVRN